MKPWKRIEPTKVTKVGWRTIVTKTFTNNRGASVVFDTMNHEGWAAAAVIALTPENKVVIARQFRAGPERLLDELPGGLLEDGETPEESVVRELREEVGYTTKNLEYLGQNSKDPYINGTCYYFLATDCMKTDEQDLDEAEEVEVRLISIKELLANAKSDKMTAAIGVLLAYEQLQELAKHG